MNEHLKSLLEQHPYLMPSFALLEAVNATDDKRAKDAEALRDRVVANIDSVHFGEGK